MCCFSAVSAPVSLLSRLFGIGGAREVRVANTSIFARHLGGGAQALVYAMELTVAGEVAMILPLPVKPGAGEDGAAFVSLEKHAGLFGDLSMLFTVPVQTMPRSKGGGFGFSFPQPRLKVHEVGSFEASFVPTMADFSRLDERFRLPESTWRALGAYDDWGFAVFRLKPGKKKRIHPMALRFATRDPSRLFFPTVHVHDGQVHEEATFDHALYFQREEEGADDAPSQDVDVKTGVERSLMQPAEDYEGLVAKARAMYRLQLRGKLPNQDTWVIP
jgi:hypothetical protein